VHWYQFCAVVKIISKYYKKITDPIVLSTVAAVWVGQGDTIVIELNEEELLLK
jgi:hypothetical protein